VRASWDKKECPLQRFGITEAFISPAPISKRREQVRPLRRRPPGYFKPGEYIIQVRNAYQGMGIGLILLRKMEEEHRINFHIQRYSESGRALAAKYLTMYPRYGLVSESTD